MSTMMDKIRATRSRVRAVAGEIEELRIDLKFRRADLKTHQALLNSLLDDEAAGVQELPYGSEDDAPPLPAEAATDATEGPSEPPGALDSELATDDGAFGLGGSDRLTDELMAAAEELGRGLEYVPPNGWDLVTSQPLTADATAEADALAAIEAGARGKPKPKRKRSKTRA